MAVDVGSAVGYLDLDISGFLASLKSAQSEADTASKNIATKIGNNISGAGKSLTSVGSTLTKSVTVPLLGIGTVGLKVATDFEKGMSEVKAISGATGEEFDALREKAIELGANTAFSANEVADGMTEMAKAGWSSEQIIDGMSGVLAAAAASGEGLASVSTIVADTITGFGLAAADSTKVADLLTQAANSGTIGISDLGESFKYVAPLANAMGISVEDAVTAISAMSMSGIKSSQAGTALSGVLSRLNGDNKKVKSTMKELGIEITNADGSFKSLDDIVAILRNSFTGMTDEQKAYYATILAGQEGQKGLLALLNLSEDEYNKIADSMDNAGGAAEQTAAIMQDNLQSKIEQLGGALESLAIKLADYVIPYLQDFISWLTSLVDKFNSLSPEQQKFIVKIALMAVVIGPILLIIGKLTSGIGNLITNVGKITSLFGKFGGAVSSVAGPAKSAASGVGGLAKSAVGLLAAGAGILLASAGLSLLAISAVKLAEAGWPAIAVMGGLVIALAGLAAGAAVIAPALTVGAVGLIAFGAAITLVGVGILAATSGMALLAAQLPVISNYGAQAAANILSLGGSMIVFGTGATIVGAGLITIGIGATSAAAGITLLGVGVIALTASIIALGAGFAVCGASLAIISAAMKSTATSVKSIEESAGKAADSLKNMITSVDVVKAGFNGLDTIVTKAVNSIAGIFTSSGPKASSSALSMATSITKNINKGLIPIPTNTIMIMTQMNEAIRYGFDSSVSYIKSLSNQSYSWGSDMIDGIIRGIKSKYGAVSSAVNGVANIIHSRLHFSRPDEGPLRDYETWMPDFMEGLAKGINDNSHLVKSAVQNVASDMKLDNIDTRKTEVFTKDDTENLKTYNITLINTIGLYKQLIEHMKICSQYSGIVSGDNGLLNSAVINTKEKVHEKLDNNDNKNEERNKPDMLTIPISIGDEQIENVVVDLLRREVRT